MAGEGKGYRTIDSGGYDILVGKGAADNDRLTFRIAGPRDFWLHVARYSGSHVVIPNPDDLDTAPREVVEHAARLAAWFSKARGARGKVEVHLCQVADVRKPRGFAAGKVELRRWESIRVYAREPPRGAETDD